MQPNQQQNYGPPQQTQQAWGGPQQQNYGPPQQQQAWSGGFVNPSGMGEGGPKPRNLIGCTVIYVPTGTQMGTAFKSSAPKESVIADLIVVSAPGGSIEYGDNGDRESPKPNTNRIAVPCFFPNVMVGNGQVMNALRGHIGEPVLGAPIWGQQAILMNKVTDADEIAKAEQIYTAHLSGQMQWPLPEPLNVQGAQQNYTNPAVIATQLNQQYPTQSGQPPQQQSWGPPQQQSWGPPQQQAPAEQQQAPAEQQQSWGQQQAPTQGQQQAPAQQQGPQGWPQPGSPGSAGM